ncbi:hypothetical protein RVR_P1202 (plasmid) [Actinacidiphila reveromycinica]|uniref:Uncharacterized protein n=1 Tax=Actinacidiphila reveromycinica TaxID=659352 RepID=A0A7R6QCM2_9ACTN|nr:hypothetical protein [Streptomyces sp. SN-593]BBG20703.1 hypothetical protein RVR_P1202 [Streptomyces sp. SN-593]
MTDQRKNVNASTSSRSYSCRRCDTAWTGSRSCWSCGRPATTRHRNPAFALNSLYRSVDRKKTV